MRLVLTGGGTAGHIYPAINVGNHMREHFNAEIFYIGKINSQEEKIAEKFSIPFHTTSSQGMSLKKFVPFIEQNIKGTIEAVKLLREINPDYVFSTGGYVSGPVIAAANLLRIPYGIHEQNTITGKVNKLFGKNARTRFYSFPIIESEKTCYSGNPVLFKERLNHTGRKLVFMGGSGGSRSINQFAVLFAKANPSVPCTLITGEKRYGETVSEGITSNLEVIAYTTNMMEIYESAKVIVCRSGSGTLFEIANLGIPSILIPFPESAEDHQKKNALYFTEKGAAILVEEGKTFEDTLKNAIEKLWMSKKEQEKMRDALKHLASPHSDKTISERILNDLKPNGR